MARLVALALVLLSLVTGNLAARAEDRDDAIRAATRVVMSQLEAFRRDDFGAAYGFASAMIRDLFDRERFEVMVRGGYPEIARSVSAFVSRANVATTDTVYLTLTIRGANGNTVEARYELVREAGDWRINGVVTREAPGTVAAPSGTARVDVDQRRSTRATSVMQASSVARSSAVSIAPPNRARS